MTNKEIKKETFKLGHCDIIITQTDTEDGFHVEIDTWNKKHDKILNSVDIMESNDLKRSWISKQEVFNRF